MPVTTNFLKTSENLTHNSNEGNNSQFKAFVWDNRKRDSHLRERYTTPVEKSRNHNKNEMHEREQKTTHKKERTS